MIQADKLPDHVRVKLPSGTVILGTVTGKKLPFPKVVYDIPLNGTQTTAGEAEVSPEALLRLAETGGALIV